MIFINYLFGQYLKWKKNINGTAIQIIENFCPSGSCVKDGYNIWLNYCLEDSKKMKPMDFAQEILSFAKRKGYFNVIVSNKEEKILKQEVELLQFTNLDKILGCGLIYKKKTDKELASYIKKEFEPLQEVFVIGDRRVDMMIGQYYDIVKTVLFGSEKSSKEFDNIDVDYNITSLNELKSIL